LRDPKGLLAGEAQAIIAHLFACVQAETRFLGENGFLGVSGLTFV
jgi:hypothetical protein